jgi:hypothetical protein
MARPGFKLVFTRIMPAAIERSTYVLASSGALLFIFWQWRPLGGIGWDVHNSAARTILFSAFASGWLLILYEIVQAMRERTGDVIAVGEGVVYPVLHGLEQNGALKSRRKSVQGRSRIYYSLTAKGRTRLAKMTATWVGIAGAIGSMPGAKDAETFG